MLIPATGRDFQAKEFIGDLLHRFATLMLTLVGALLSIDAKKTSAFAEESRVPNIVLILADDLGYSDLGCFGGEIATPSLDRLAADGVRLTQFHTTARCCPSRASLLTGHYPHRVGLGHMTQDIGQPGYRGRLATHAPTIAEVLAGAGYRSLLAGKWHLGTNDPTRHGFEEFYGTIVSAKTYWDPGHFLRLPADRPTIPSGPDGFYGTDAITNHALQFIEQARQTPDRPWFLFLSYHAPHFPLHARPADIAKYENTYTQGWDAVREARLTRMQRSGIVPKDTELSSPSPYWNYGDTDSGVNPAWNGLPEDRRRDLARRMAIYAAMVDRMDANIGRITADLSKHGELKNTLIVFLSDNGACAEWGPFGFDVESSNLNLLHRGDRLQQMGSHGTFHSGGSGWASASNTPFRLYKHYCHQGGVLTPCIVHWPAGLGESKGSVCDTPAHLIDLLPTAMAVSGAEYPNQHNDRSTVPSPGRNLLPILRGEQTPTRAIFLEHEGNRGVRRGKWKLVALRDQPWELYDLGTDPTESHDLASSQPEVVTSLAAEWDKWAKENQVTPLPRNYGVDYLNREVPKPPVIPKAIGEMQKLVSGFRHAQGPAWDGEDSLYFSDIPNSTIHRLRQGSDGKWKVTTLREGKHASHGIVTDGKDGLILCEANGGRIVSLAKDGREMAEVRTCDDRQIGIPNDLWRHPDGSVYFTIPRTNQPPGKVAPDVVTGTVCRISPDGETVREVGRGLRSPHGIVGSADGKRLYVSDTDQCWRLELKENGEVSHAVLAASQGSDGLAVDEYRHLYTTSEVGVVIYTPTAERIGMIRVPESPTNMTFGGVDNRKLFITTRSAVYVVTLNVRGG